MKPKRKPKLAEVCEWKEDRNGSAYCDIHTEYFTHCKYISVVRKIEIVKFCPFCGKLIKVVGVDNQV